MAIYIIGDLQGCYDAFQKLLKKIKFSPIKDKLIFCGDLVNRGGQSLETLKWVYNHRNVCKVILGNHDLSMLAQYFTLRDRTQNIEFKQIFDDLNAPYFMDWLLQQKLMLHLKGYKCVVVHAGIYPKWSLKRAKKESQFTMKKLRKNPTKFFLRMFGSRPNHYKEKSKGMNRARFAINSFTRMRFLQKNSGINFKAKGEISSFNKLIPWFRFSPRKKIKPLIIFGHWSALGLFKENNTVCIDSGKVWGGRLTAVELPKKKSAVSFDDLIFHQV